MSILGDDGARYLGDQGIFARGIVQPDVRFLALADITAAMELVRFVPGADMRACRVRAGLVGGPPRFASPLWSALRTRSLFGDRPPLRDTLTGGRPPGRKVPDPNWGLEDNKRK